MRKQLYRHIAILHQLAGYANDAGDHAKPDLISLTGHTSNPEAFPIAVSCVPLSL